LTDYLPSETIFLLCEPEALAEHADQYAQQVPEDNPFLAGWEEFQEQLARQGMTSMEVREVEIANPEGELIEAEEQNTNAARLQPEPPSTRNLQSAPLPISSLEAFRPLGDRTPEAQIAEAQRREFFTQLHRWLRQGY